MTGWLTSGAAALVKIGAELRSGGKILGGPSSVLGIGEACIAGLRKVIKMHKIGKRWAGTEFRESGEADSCVCLFPLTLYSPALWTCLWVRADFLFLCLFMCFCRPMG